MNGLCRLSHLVRDVQGSASADLKDTYVTQIEETSREFEQETGRQFWAETDTRTFDSNGEARFLTGDLLSISALTIDEDGDGTFETTLTVTTDYLLWPRNPKTNTPYRGIDLVSGGQLGSFPVGQNRVRIAGVWGYSNETEATGVTTNEAVDASETNIDVTPNPTGLIDVGDTIYIDSEQMDVTAVYASSIDVTRALNGTTAATHTTSTAITRRRYPRDVEKAIKARAQGERWATQGGFDGAEELAGLASRDRNGKWFAAIRRYTDPGSYI